MSGTRSRRTLIFTMHIITYIEDEINPAVQRNWIET